MKAALEALVEPLTRGDHVAAPVDVQEPRETDGGVDDAGMAREFEPRWDACSTSWVRLRSVCKSREGTSHPDRNAQFEYINATAAAFLHRKDPVISVDTKKKELAGDCKNGWREWQPRGMPELVRVHEFPGDAVGKAILYGVYDMARNEAWVSVARDHDTPAFAVASIRQWWTMMGRRAYPPRQDAADHGRCGWQQWRSLSGMEDGTATLGR